MREFTLSEEQLSMLRHIYAKRLNLLIAVFTALPLVFGGTLFNMFRKEVEERTPIFTITFLFFTLAIVLTLVYLYFYKVLPVKKDLTQKSGNYKDKVIVNKSFFEHVNQFYLFFDDVDLPNKEITHEEFIRYQIGDAYPIPLGKNSNLVLDGFMNYDLF